ncbi:FHA domain-containing protein [Kribbella sp. DT2]|uniref:FHA domain-containing protein n=1 Tax=Kribbella sp. DT2 TaxID=3393427 RepID=UPI003CF8A6C5
MTSGLELTRPSDRERDRALEILREGAGTGRLSQDTFVRRMNFVLGAQSRRELRDATQDLPGREPRVVEWLRELVSKLPRVELTPRTKAQLPGLALPPAGSPTIRIGRGPGATLRIADASVSRRHAELRRVGEGWMIRDLNSMNGTHLNGSRITSPTAVRAGDIVQFGSVLYTLTWSNFR